MTILHDSPVFVGHETKAEAMRVGELLARRLADPDLVAAAVSKSEAIADFQFSWGGAGLYSGPAASALTFQYAARAMPADADRWQRLAREYLAKAVTTTHEIPLMTAGLAAGTAGLATAVAVCAADEPRFGNALGTLEAQLATQVLASPSWRGENGVADSDYDVIVGAAGVLAYLADTASTQPLVEQAAESVIADLTWLCTPVDGRRPWHIQPESYPMEEYRDPYPNGYVNLGLAHGVPGVLAALSVAASAGHDQVRETVRSVADYLVDAAFHDDYGLNWANGIPLTPAGAEDRAGMTPARVAWCYGAPGIACALLRAAAALGDHRLEGIAVEAFEAVLRRVGEHGRFGSATLCHGVAGMLAMTVMFARETGSERARLAVEPLTAQLLSHCDETFPLGVQDLEQPGGALLDSPSLLSGSAGVALALWSAAGAIDPRWERAFLIS